jgi:hypothetical protein
MILKNKMKMMLRFSAFAILANVEISDALLSFHRPDHRRVKVYRQPCDNQIVSSPLHRMPKLGASPSCDESPAQNQSIVKSSSKFMEKNFFVVGMAAAISSAALYPSLGVHGGPLKPEVTVDAIGVALIFLLNGFSLPTSELTSAARDLKLNGLIQGFNLGVIPFAVWGLLKGLSSAAQQWGGGGVIGGGGGGLGALATATATTTTTAATTAGSGLGLMDGVVALACLPTTVNMCIVLTGSAGGATAASLFNAVLGNMLGVFVSPLLLFRFLGAERIALPYLSVLAKLSKKVSGKKVWRGCDAKQKNTQPSVSIPHLSFFQSQAPSSRSLSISLDLSRSLSLGVHICLLHCCRCCFQWRWGKGCGKWAHFGSGASNTGSPFLGPQNSSCSPSSTPPSATPSPRYFINLACLCFSAFS